MPRFARYLGEGMRERGHEVSYLEPEPRLHRLPAAGGIKKWLGYLDQFAVFPQELRRAASSASPDTLYVFTDQALGMLVPTLAARPHVIHCHDFLALRSALGEFPENPTNRSGRIYQSLIRKGFSKGRNFISVSWKTRTDLHRFLPAPPALSEVVHNGLTQDFTPLPAAITRARAGAKTGLDLTRGYLLHVGGNQWYKNRAGVVELYGAYHRSTDSPLPLLLLGAVPSPSLRERVRRSSAAASIHFLTGVEDETVRLAYAGASAFLFPSLEEGFGWPIAEAMASGVPVLTTRGEPMTEVGGEAAFYIPREPREPGSKAEWARGGAETLNTILALREPERAARVAAGLAQAAGFQPGKALDAIEHIYRRVLKGGG